MKQTTKEQVSVTLLVDLEYETQEGREWLIKNLKRDLPYSANLRGTGIKDGSYAMLGVNGSVTVSSNDESQIQAYKVYHSVFPPAIIRTTWWLKATRIFAEKHGISPMEMFEIEATRAPEFDWNSNLLAGDVYSLEHAEAGNKKS